MPYYNTITKGEQKAVSTKWVTTEEGGADIAEIEILQVLSRATDVAQQNIEAFRKAMAADTASECYSRALYIFCAEQIAYYFCEHLENKDDDEKLAQFGDGELETLAFLSGKGYLIPALLAYIIGNDSISMSNMDEVETSIQEVLRVGRISEPLFGDILFEYVLPQEELKMWE